VIDSLFAKLLKPIILASHTTRIATEIIKA